MQANKNKPIYTAIGCVAVLILLVALVPALVSSPDENTMSTNEFNQLVFNRYEGLKNDGFTEIESAKCVNDDCSQGLILVLNTVPEDYDMLARSNVITYSNFMDEHLSNDKATLSFEHNGETVITCEASNKTVTSCE